MIECADFDLEPGFYLNLMHALSIVALLMNLFAVFCVVRKSTKQMGVYKWYLLVYQAASTLFDFVYTSLTLPVIFFPVPMGYPGAWIAEWLSISSHAATITVILTCSMMAAAMLSLFNYRLFVVTPTNHFMRISDNGHIYTSVALWALYITLCFAGVLDILPDQTEARKWAVERYSCAKSAMSVPKLTIFSLDKLERIGLLVGGLAVLGLIICIASVILSFRFIKRRGNLSSKTRQMQKRFLIYLCIQVSVPVFSIIIPIGMLQYVFRTHSSTQRDLGNLACALVGSHGCITTLSLIMCNEPYRTFVTGPLIRLWKLRRRPASREVTEFTRSTHQQAS